MEEDELRRIRERKLRSFMKRSFRRDAESSVPSLRKPIELTDADLLENIRKYPIVVVDCWAPWCGPCRMVSPVIEELARDYVGKIVFGKLNVDENRKAAARYGIMSIPTLLVFKDSKLVDQIIGAMPRKILEEKIRRYL